VHGVGAHLNARTDFAENRRLLVNLDIVAGFQKATRGGKSAKTGAGYKYFSFCHLS